MHVVSGSGRGVVRHLLVALVHLADTINGFDPLQSSASLCSDCGQSNRSSALEITAMIAPGGLAVMTGTLVITVEAVTTNNYPGTVSIPRICLAPLCLLGHNHHLISSPRLRLLLIRRLRLFLCRRLHLSTLPTVRLVCMRLSMSMPPLFRCIIFDYGSCC